MRDERVRAPGAAFLLIDDVADCTYPLRTGLNTLGRHRDNDIVLTEPVVSRRHCVLIVHARGGCELHDTASLNGTFVNGMPIHEPTRLASGDRITLCGRPLLFVCVKDCEAREEDDAGSNTAWA